MQRNLVSFALAFGSIVSVTLSLAQGNNPADVVKQQCAGAKVVAEFWHGFTTAQQQNVLNALAVEFNKTQRGTCVLPVPQGNYQDLSTKLSAAFAAGKVPTFAQAFENNIALYLESNKLQDLATLGVKLSYVQPRFVEAVTFSGKQVAVPFNKSVQLMYFNKTLLKKYNSPVPRTLDEFAATVRKISKAQNAPAWWLAPDASTFGFVFFTMGGNYEPGGNLTLNSPTAVRALEWIVKLVEEKAAKPITSGFINGQLNDTYLASFDTSAGFPFYRNAAKFELGATTLPGANLSKPGTAVIQGTNLVVFKDANREAQAVAARFLNFAIQPRNSAIFAISTNYVPSSTLAENEQVFKDYLKDNPDYGAVLKQARFAQFEPKRSQWESIRFNILGAAVREAVAGKIEPKAALDQAQKQVQDLLSGRAK